MVDLLWLAIGLFILAFLAYMLGARGFAWFTADIAKFIIWIVIIIALITLAFRILS